MATNYPANLDNLSNPAAGDSMADVSHADQHANANDAIEAIEAELGTDPSGSAATVKARIAAVESTANGAAQKSANLSDLTSASTARTNLGLGTAATTDASAYATAAQGTDARTPTAHKTSHATGGTDALAPSDIGAAPAWGISPSAITGTAVVTNDARLSDARTPTDGSVTLAKLADNSSLVVSATAPASPKVGTIWVQSDATVDVAPPYTTAQIADSAITSAKIADGTIVNADVSASAAIAPAKIDGTAVVQARTITAGTGLTGGGDLSANRTLSVSGLTNNEIASGAAIAASKISGTAVVQGDLPQVVNVPSIVPPNASSTTLTYVTLSGYYSAYVVAGTSIDNYMQWAASVAAGTYTLRVITRGTAGTGIISISIDGAAALATTIDTYAASTSNNNITDITGIALTAGSHTIRYTVSSKNASSTGYQQAIQGFSLTRTGA